MTSSDMAFAKIPSVAPLKMDAQNTPCGLNPLRAAHLIKRGDTASYAFKSFTSREDRMNIQHQANEREADHSVQVQPDELDKIPRSPTCTQHEENKHYRQVCVIRTSSKKPGLDRVRAFQPTIAPPRLVLPRFHSGPFQAMFAMHGMKSGCEGHKRVSP